MIAMKTANEEWRLYKKDGGELSFKEWLNDRKKNYKATGSGEMPSNKPLSDSIRQTLDDLHRQAGFKDELSDEYVLGMPKNVVIIAAVIISVTIGAYLIYQHKSK